MHNNASCQEGYVPLSEHEELLNRYDLLVRILRNNKMSAGYRILYAALVDDHPAVLSGDRTPVDVFTLCDEWGISGETAKKFWVDMAAAEVFFHESGSRGIASYVTANTDVAPYPEYVDTRNTPARQKERKAQKERIQAMKRAAIVFNCTECGGPIEYGLHPVCKKCHHVHPPLEHVDATRITIEPLPVNDLDGFQEPHEHHTEPLPAIRRNPETPRPMPAEPTRPSFACGGCGKREFQMPISKDRWMCVNCGKAYTLYNNVEVEA